MKLKLQYCVWYNEQLKSILEHKRIKYKIVGDDIIVRKQISFSVYQDDNVNLPNRYLSSPPIVSKEFSTKELNTASYLTFLPRIHAIEIVNANRAFRFSCESKTLFGKIRYSHKEQIDSLTIKPYKLNQETTILASATGFGEIFARERFQEFIAKYEVKGIQCQPVFEYRNGSILKSNFSQLACDTIIPFHRISLLNVDKILRCSVCKKPKLVCSQSYQLILLCSDNELTDDAYITDSVFGEGISFPLFMVSQRIYQLMKKEKLARNVNFTPVLFQKDNHNSNNRS